MKPFLTAEWRNLFLATYAVSPDLLRPRLPQGLDLDTRDGQAFVSLVAFQFLNTRVFSIPWPGYRNFTELNLRFYVRHGSERGVVFLREFVPQRLVAWLARALYNEPYRRAPLWAECFDEEETLTMEYRLQWGGREHFLAVTGHKPAFLPPLDSDEQFFKEHRWGFGISRGGQGLRYEVVHEPWKVYPVRDHRIDLDWGLVYGPEWAFLGKASPLSTILAAGSAVRVYPKGKVTPG